MIRIRIFSLILPLDARILLRREISRMQGAKVFILLGSNQGDRSRLLALAGELISERAGKTFAASRVYESQPWGYCDNQYFLNQVIGIRTGLLPAELLKSLLGIEVEMGRVRQLSSSGIYQSRTIDLDILMYDDLTMESPDLIIPHPRMHLRMFTLLPMSEIASKTVHPVLGKTIAALVDECQDPLIVKPLFEQRTGV